MVDSLLDLRNLKCPLPALHTRKKLNTMHKGDYISIIATDPLSMIDIPHVIHQLDAELIEAKNIGNEYHFHVKK
jgi:tRNA 2-thiouridine synthesizing protein A